MFFSVWLTSLLEGHLDSLGRALDNIFIARLWRSVKYEEVYLNDYQSVTNDISVTQSVLRSHVLLMRLSIQISTIPPAV